MLSDESDRSSASATFTKRRQDRTAYEGGLVAGFGQLIADRVHLGWSCHLVTVMFGPIPGTTGARGDRMKDEIQRVYSTLLTRVHRKPRTAAPDKLPVLIGALDLPVYKRDRSSVVSVLRNCGLHFHTIVLLPPVSRLKGSLADHFQDNAVLYAGPTKLLERIHVVPVTHDHERVVFKTVLNGRLTPDDAILVLPRARSELGLRDSAAYPPSKSLNGMWEADLA